MVDKGSEKSIIDLFTKYILYAVILYLHYAFIDKYDISCNVRGRVQHSDCRVQYGQHFFCQSDCRWLIYVYHKNV